MNKRLLLLLLLFCSIFSSFSVLGLYNPSIPTNVFTGDEIDCSIVGTNSSIKYKWLINGEIKDDILIETQDSYVFSGGLSFPSDKTGWDINISYNLSNKYYESVKWRVKNGYYGDIFYDLNENCINDSLLFKVNSRFEGLGSRIFESSGFGYCYDYSLSGFSTLFGATRSDGGGVDLYAGSYSNPSKFFNGNYNDKICSNVNGFIQESLCRSSAVGTFYEESILLVNSSSNITENLYYDGLSFGDTVQCYLEYDNGTLEYSNIVNVSNYLPEITIQNGNGSSYNYTEYIEHSIQLFRSFAILLKDRSVGSIAAKINLSRILPLKLSIKAFCCGLPGWMKLRSTPVDCDQSNILPLTNSGPLSQIIAFGFPRYSTILFNSLTTR